MMKDKDIGKIINKPILFYICIAVGIAIAILLNIFIFNYNLLTFVVLVFLGFYLGKWAYFKFWNNKK